MNEQDLAKYASQLYSRVPLLGPRLRREACRKLAEDSSSGAIPYLIEALRSDDSDVRLTADAALRALKDAAAIDILCVLWRRGVTSNWAVSLPSVAMSPASRLRCVYCQP